MFSTAIYTYGLFYSIGRIRTGKFLFVINQQICPCEKK